MKIAILILAAGSSSRMGHPKQLLSINNNTTLLGLAIEQATKSKANKTYCILGANAKQIENTISHYNMEAILNLEFKKGLSSSIVKGIKHIEPFSFDAVLIMLSDQPKVNTAYINQLIDTFTKNSDSIVASNYSHTYGVPAIFPKNVFTELLKLKGDRGAKVFLNKGNFPIKHIYNESLLDIDTPKDYEDFLKSEGNI